MGPEQPTREAIRVLVVDDHPAVREGLALLLAPEGIDVCCEADGRKDALAIADSSRPQVALVDLSLGDEDGLALVRDLHARAVPTLVYSMHEDSRHVEGAFAAGAMGYVTKRAAHRMLVEAICDVAAGRRFVCPAAAVALARGIADGHAESDIRNLSEQEGQVFRLLGRGEGTLEIAAAMRISSRTVESYYARILEKLNLDGMQSLRRHAISHLSDATS